jgi:hypothetical protein
MLRELERNRVGRMGTDSTGKDVLCIYAGRPSAGAKALGIGPRCEWGNPFPVGHEADAVWTAVLRFARCALDEWRARQTRQAGRAWADMAWVDGNCEGLTIEASGAEAG